jgi:tRNA isopentenyl-2-thiomethyl-A-37 hydroxylase MiaE
MNGKGLLDEEGKRSWEGTEAYANMYSEIAEFYEGLLASILRKYEDSKMPFPPGIK